ncbi:hypothetical protein NDU88_006092, partial [Pleurodeles waltl]
CVTVGLFYAEGNIVCLLNNLFYSTSIGTKFGSQNSFLATQILVTNSPKFLCEYLWSLPEKSSQLPFSLLPNRLMTTPLQNSRSKGAHYVIGCPTTGPAMTRGGCHMPAASPQLYYNVPAGLTGGQSSGKSATVLISGSQGQYH